jgi:hypothetical protein
VTVENIETLCDKYAIPKSIDFLSIDIDGNDWHIWRELSKHVTARVVVIEFNASWPPPEDCVLPYDPQFAWTATCRYGASIQAYYNLARSLGYSLVYQEIKAINLFFVLDSVLAEKGVTFVNQNNPAKIFTPPNHRSGARDGHAPDENRDYETSESLLAVNS